MRRARYGLIVLVLGTVAACTSDATTKPSDPPVTPSSVASSPTVSPSPTATPSPSVATTGPNVRPGEKVPVLPALAKTNSRPGAAVFASYWFQALDWGYATTDSTLAKTLYLPQCADCARFVGIFDRVKKDGQHFQGGRVRLLSRTAVDGDTRHPGTNVIDVRISVQALRTLNAAGKIVAKNPAQKDLPYRLWCQWTGGNHWQLLDYKRVITS